MASRRDDVGDHLSQTLRMLERELDQKLAVLGLAEVGSTPEPMGASIEEPGHMSLPTGRLRRTRGMNASDRTEPVNVGTPKFGVPLSTSSARVDFSLPQQTQSMGREPITVNTPANTNISDTNFNGDLRFDPRFAYSLSEQKVTKPVVQPDNYDGKTPFEDWLSHMELCANINNWTIEQKTKFLAVKLRGPALQVYTDLAHSKKQSYTELVQALKERFCPQGQVELFRAQLRARSRRKGESLQQLASEIRRLVLKAFPNVSSKFREEMGRDQFIEALDLPDVRIQVRRSKPSSLGKALTLALEEEAYLQLECNKNPLPKHVVASANEGTLNLLAEQSTQVNSDLENKLREIEQTLKELKRTVGSKPRYSATKFLFSCWECKEVGHRRAQCPKLVSQAMPKLQTPINEGNDSGLCKGPLPSPQ